MLLSLITLLTAPFLRYLGVLFCAYTLGTFPTLLSCIGWLSVSNAVFSPLLLPLSAPLKSALTRLDPVYRMKGQSVLPRSPSPRLGTLVFSPTRFFFYYLLRSKSMVERWKIWEKVGILTGRHEPFLCLRSLRAHHRVFVVINPRARLAIFGICRTELGLSIANRLLRPLCAGRRSSYVEVSASFMPGAKQLVGDFHLSTRFIYLVSRPSTGSFSLAHPHAFGRRVSPFMSLTPPRG